MPSHAHWPRDIDGRLGRDVPSRLWAIGKLEILAERKVGLFCSIRCPGDAILAAYDAAQKLRDEGIAVISGFHSPVEKECLRILLQGKQPIIISLARSLGRLRLPAEWRQALASGRLLLLSRFEKSRRADKNTAHRRNELVAALSDEVLIIHAEPGGRIEHITMLVDRWSIPRRHPGING